MTSLGQGIPGLDLRSNTYLLCALEDVISLSRALLSLCGQMEIVSLLQILHELIYIKFGEAS